MAFMTSILWLHIIYTTEVRLTNLVYCGKIYTLISTIKHVFCQPCLYCYDGKSYFEKQVELGLIALTVGRIACVPLNKG